MKPKPTIFNAAGDTSPLPACGERVGVWAAPLRCATFGEGPFRNAALTSPQSPPHRAEGALQNSNKTPRVNEAPAPGLFRGRTVHVRFGKVEHKLAYEIFQLLVDVDDPCTSFYGLKWLKHNRFAPFAFYDRDHGDRSGAPLRCWVEARLREAGVEIEGGQIRLLTFPRVLGFVFNPISVFFAYGNGGDLRGVIYEVNNTFGETHSYVAPANNHAVEHHSADKVFHVSPFFDVSGRYAFTLRAPGDGLTLVIDKYRGAVRDHVATLKAKRLPLNDNALIKAFFTIPFLTLKVVAAIHYEALKLLIKGARYHDKPAPPPLSSIAKNVTSTIRTPVTYD